MKTLKEFDQNMQKEEFRKEFEKKAEVIHEENPDWSELELISKTAKELGYDMPVELLEKKTAETQELDEEELKQVAGGSGIEDAEQEYMETVIDIITGNCRNNAIATDEYNHNANCVTAWHCYTATLHTGTNSEKVSCWKNYKCFVINK